jgi:hypothetical protein
VPMGMSDREHDIIMWRDLQNQRRSRAGGQEPQSGGCLPKFLLAVVVFFVLAYAAAHLPGGANSNSCNGQDCRSDGKTSGVPPTSSALTQGQLTSDDQALELLRAEARPPIEAQLIDKWVPQIGSYEVNGDTSDKDILSSQRTQQTQFQALLLMTDDYTTATPGYWVSIAPVPSESADGALAWCADQNLDLDHCFARFITHDPAVTDISKH